MYPSKVVGSKDGTGGWVGTTVTTDGFKANGICSGDGDLIKGGERTCFRESSGRGELGRWNWFMYAIILARSVEEATSSSRSGFWWKGNQLEVGGGLYNLRLSRPPRRSPMAVAEAERKKPERRKDQRQGKTALFR